MLLDRHRRQEAADWTTGDSVTPAETRIEDPIPGTKETFSLHVNGLPLVSVLRILVVRLPALLVASLFLVMVSCQAGPTPTSQPVEAMPAPIISPTPFPTSTPDPGSVLEEARELMLKLINEARRKPASRRWS